MACILSILYSISFHTVYFLSIFYVVYIEFLTILHTFCKYFVYILWKFSLSSIHIPCVFYTHSANIANRTWKYRSAICTAPHTLTPITVRIMTSVWHVTCVPDVIPQSSTVIIDISGSVPSWHLRRIYWRGRNRFQVPASRRRQLASLWRLLQTSKQLCASRRIQIAVYDWQNSANRTCDRLRR
jgi:hypothetical protein